MEGHALDYGLGCRQGMGLFAHGTEILSHKMQGICWVAKELIAFQKGLCSTMVLVMYCHISHCLQISVIVFFFLVILSGFNN